jgi:hypothetical protein
MRFEISLSILTNYSAECVVGHLANPANFGDSSACLHHHPTVPFRFSKLNRL